jgi:hypothetical protein
MRVLGNRGPVSLHPWGNPAATGADLCGRARPNAVLPVGAAGRRVLISARSSRR